MSVDVILALLFGWYLLLKAMEVIYYNIIKMAFIESILHTRRDNWEI